MRVPFSLFLFTFALLIRVIGLRWGLPSAAHWYSYHPDESPRQIVGAVAGILSSGDFNPHFFNYPSLYIYLTSFAYLLMSMLGLTTTAASSAPWPVLQDITLAGRLVTALLGAATVPVVYLIGREIRGHRLGLAAALLMALLPGHVQHSHFATVDVPATFFVALSLYFAVRALRPRDENSPSWSNKQLCIAAGMAGLAAATKYNGGVVIVAPIFSWFLLARRGLIISRASFALLPAMAVLGFLIGCPYSVLSFGEFWGDCKINGVCYELMVHPRLGSGEIFKDTGNGWWYHLSFNLPFMMTWPLLIATLIGLAMAVLQRTRWRWSTAISGDGAVWLPLLAWSALYCVTLGLSQVRFMRYTLPLMPAFCVFAAGGVMMLRDAAGSTAGARRFRIPAAFALCGALGIAALMGTATVLLPFVATDPRDAAAQFLRAQQKTPTTVGLISPPWFWTPPLSLRDAPPGTGSVVTESPDGRYKFAVTGFDTTKLQSAQPQWFIISEYEWMEKERLRDAEYEKFMDVLHRQYSLAASFPASGAGKSEYEPHDFLYTHPVIRIYRRG